MGKKNKPRTNQSKSQSRAQTTRAATSVQSQGNSSEQAIKEAHEEAKALATEQDLAAMTSEPLPLDGTVSKIWEMAREARDIFRSAAARAEQAERAAEERRRAADSLADGFLATEQELASRSAALDERERELVRHEESAQARERALLSDKHALAEKEKELRRRELNAEAGFLAERQVSLARLEEAAAALREDSDAAQRAIAEERAAWDAEKRTRWKTLHEELDIERRQAHEELERLRVADREAMRVRCQAFDAECTRREQGLYARELELEKLRREADKTRERLQWEEEELREERTTLAERAERLAARIREDLEHRIETLEAQLDQVRKDRDNNAARLRAREEADRQFGQRTPEQVLAELEALSGKNAELEAALAARPDADAAARLAELEHQSEVWQVERQELHRQNAELKYRLAREHCAAIELETLRDEKAALESGRAGLQQALEALRADIKRATGHASAKKPMPLCSRLDEDSGLQLPMPRYDEVSDLKQFVADIQYRIAIDPGHSERRLYYSLPDLRSFLGGLAMGRLILLQGISGTGKTSLPVAFARALGTTATVIAVQAGWRDPQDLVGHYNAFEKRVHEKEMLEALYRALTPRGEDEIHIIVLDEMNLSHPEQYFSDFLSALEKPQEPYLTLLDDALESAPSRLLEGRKLPIARNVWFVGTANHDETTKDFADKTYDRAHVMELPHHPERFHIELVQPRLPVSFQALERAFDAAINRHGNAAKQALELLDSAVREPLAQNFEIGWGERLKRQLSRYVPVVVAAGGSVGEAADHLLAMRLLRKLKNRYDNRPEHLEDLRQKIEGAWQKLGSNTPPTRSLKLLDAELRSRGQASGGTQ